VGGGWREREREREREKGKEKNTARRKSREEKKKAARTTKVHLRNALQYGLQIRCNMDCTCVCVVVRHGAVVLKSLYDPHISQITGCSQAFGLLGQPIILNIYKKIDN
jgi:hypothetical protein